MALTGIEIFKLLPKTNCGECGVPTCLAFAMSLAAGKAELAACPNVSEEAKAKLEEASAPPIRPVTIGGGDTAVKVGGETVLFRHEKRFENPPGLALLISDAEPDSEIDAKLERFKKFRFLYPNEMKLRDRVNKIAKVVYGADGVSWTPEAEAKAKAFEADPKYDEYATMMVKTHLSLSHDPTLKGVPKGWILPIRDVLIYSGAKFLCPCAGSITLMPGTSSNPAFRRVDVDVNTGKVQGLF